ncbi:MAG: hypothetical protein ACI4RR_05520 [Eubacterium sp.]
MANVPINVCVPDDIYEDILNGTLEIYGLVKDGNNRIVKHLPTVQNAVETGAKKALAIIKEHKGTSIVVGSVLAIGTGVAVTISCVSNSKKKKDIKFFNECLEHYYSSIKDGTLNNEIIDNLIQSLEILQEKKITLKMSPTKLSAIIFSIFDYTNKLAEANNQKVTISKPKKKDNIIDIREYLEMQKEIISNVS